MHCLIVTMIDNEQWLVDVGFGESIRMFLPDQSRNYHTEEELIEHNESVDDENDLSTKTGLSLSLKLSQSLYSLKAKKKAEQANNNDNNDDNSNTNNDKVDNNGTVHTEESKTTKDNNNDNTNTSSQSATPSQPVLKEAGIN